MTSVTLLGLPGLYQNWLRAALDPDSVVHLHGEQNFLCNQSQVAWLQKIGLEQYPVADEHNIVVNVYVNNDNFVWYLYNFFEKTFDINIQVSHLIDDLLGKGDSWYLYREFKNGYLQYLQSTSGEFKNSIDIDILFFYRVIQYGEDFVMLTKFTNTPVDGYINIEYNDFSDVDLLVEKLNTIPFFNEEHFRRLYESLYSRNKIYLNRKETLLNKLKNNQFNFDILETAYIGAVFSQMNKKEVSWHNPKVRQAVLKHKSNELYNYLCDKKKYLNV